MSERERLGQIGRQRLLWMYEMMFKSRSFDERLIALLGGYYHSGIGQEAIGVAAGAQLRREDYIFYHHRGCTQIIAKGLALSKMFGDFLGKTNGTVKGKGAGIVHIADTSIGILGQGGTVGSCFPLSFGAAFSAKYRGTDQVTVAFFGESTANRGTFHESLNWAAVQKLPLIWICENNGYAVSVPTSDSTSGRIADRAFGYGIPGVQVDGQDAVAVYEVVEKAMAHVKAGNGPYLIEALTYRYRGHFEGDDTSYRTAEELEMWKKRDPIAIHRQRLLEHDFASEELLAEIEQKVMAEIAEAVKEAQEAPLPDPSIVLEHVYA